MPVQSKAVHGKTFSEDFRAARQIAGRKILWRGRSLASIRKAQIPLVQPVAGTCLNKERDSARIPRFPTMADDLSWSVNEMEISL
jgi:hypothetical protein